MVAEHQHNRPAHLRSVLRLDKSIEGGGDAVAPGAQLATDEDVEALDLAPLAHLCGRYEREVLGFGVGAVVATASDGNVEFAGQVGKSFVAHEHGSELPSHRGGVEQLRGRQSGDRTADNVADVVHTGLEAGDEYILEAR